jgi:hydroxyethylthiazole kinase-like uncharacterized protein yjeF
MRKFDPEEIKNIYKSPQDSSKTENGQITIIGGSKLFHGAPVLALVAASRIVDMVYFASPEPSIGDVAAGVKSKLSSFIWVPWRDADKYIKKSDSSLIGSGLMRAKSEEDDANKAVYKNDDEFANSRKIVQDLLLKFPYKNWVIDAGALQVMDAEWIPENAILTPNKKEYGMLFAGMDPYEAAKKYKCIIVIKGPETFVYSSIDSCIIEGGNAGLTKGGSGDVEAGLTAALLAKNDPFLAATVASYVVKKAAEKLSERMGTYYNSDDLSLAVSETLNDYSK